MLEVLIAVRRLILYIFNETHFIKKDYKALADKIMLVKNNYADFDSESIRTHILNNYGSVVFRKRISDIYKSLIR